MNSNRTMLMASTALLFSAAFSAAPAAADEAAPAAEDTAIVVTGSRFGSRSAADSSAPIDLINTEELARGGRSEVQDILKNTVPSFSTPRPSASGVGDFTAPPSLRGLSPGQLLLMVNGKRRHSTGDLSTSNGIGRGDVAYDFNAIPTVAIKQVEVLRDGASAQYGSDAISGVINITLDDTVGARGKVTTGITKEGDGEFVDAGLSYGAPLPNGGVIRASAEFKHHALMNRAKADTRQQYFGTDANGNPTTISSYYGSGTGLTASNGTLDARESTVDRMTSFQGTPEYDLKTLFLNAELPTSGDVTFYAFGGYSHLKGETPFFFRRAGQDQTVRSIHPNGFQPIGAVKLQNFSAFAGARGDDLFGFGWDLSSGYGKSLIDQSTINSNNVSLGDDSPTSFYRSGTRFGQWTTNLDLTREIDLGDGAPLNLALGAEYRRETYRQIAGELASYQNGGVAILDGPNAGNSAAVGSQPSPGLSPDGAVYAKRNSKAVYGEVEKVFFDRLTLDGALRFEDFSDFGSTTNFKVSGRFELTDTLAVRGSYSTGFRAPNLAQSYFSSSVTNFIDGSPVLVSIAPVNSEVAQLLGAEKLKPETSKNISAGFVWQNDGFVLTVDAYQIALDDRIVISSVFSGTAITSYLAENGYAGYGGVNYLTNAVDTTTRGIDVTLSKTFYLTDDSELQVLLAGNYNKTKFDRIAGTPDEVAALGVNTAVFDLTQKVRTSDSQPRSKILLNTTWKSGKWKVGLTNTYFGKVRHVAFTSLSQAKIDAVTKGFDVDLVPIDGSSNYSVIQNFKGKIITDLQVSYDVTPAFTVTGGVNNLFDVYPTTNLLSTAESVAAGTNGSDNGGTLPYNAISPFGFSGMSFFLSAGFKL